MIHPDVLIEQFSTTHWVVLNQAKGLCHADSLIQPPVRGNCLNWVVGHVMLSRNGILKLLGQEPVWQDDVGQRYARGTEPVTGETEGILPLEDLLAAFELSQERLMVALNDMTLEDMSQADEDGRTLGQKLGFFFFHEAYHSGQTELLRQLSGVDDAIIA